ncbi:PPC domain-containing DNA-binding protein [Vibrio fluvialis]|uniref:PPC domain-containing DNA-binding protein n=1 Tax=Vibrio fluvialis TaxID=676 RepID=UPI00193BDB40|nr:PPC domain-containing DNA-binding protein [Vibrio fluvialis]MBY8020931.1 DNA-binding protein [Vibrio fluvialis]HDM8048389.1 DNA-binding protein [Vibrio fluvialis]
MIKVLATRLTQGADLKQSIMALVQEHSITAGSIASCAGCLSQLNIRLADSISTLSLQAPFEIVSLMGTLTPHHLHLHIAVADSQGKVWGGHLLDGNLINTTAELIVYGYPDLAFDREYDAHTGFTELTIQTK